MSEEIRLFDHKFTAEAGDSGERLDLFLVRRIPGYSRTHLSAQIKAGRVAVNGRTSRKVRPGLRLEADDVVEIRLGQRTEPYAAPEKIDLAVLHEDEVLLVIDKPPGISMHPGAGQPGGTMANAFAYHFGRLSQVQGALRPGIVHRLDKDTSGVLLVAKDDRTHEVLAEQFRRRTVQKEYLAVVKGVMEFDADLVSLPIGPHRTNRTRMAVRIDVGRASETYYEVAERFDGFSLVRCMPRTGRTHQIRVHMRAIHHPIVSDRTYGGVVRTLMAVCQRQALHAHRITFRHPKSGESVTFEAPLHADMLRLIETLRNRST